MYAIVALPCALLLAWSDVADGARTGLAYHPDFLLHDPGTGHPDRPARLEAIMDHLKSRRLLEASHTIDPAPADERWLRQVHTETFLKQLEQSAEKAPTYLDPDTALSADSYRVAKLATGAVLTAVDLIMANEIDNAFVAARPPGHHALPDRAMGFCLINHIAVATRYVQKRYGLKRILIVDWDVHHGNGTQDIFYDDPTVLYFSTHQWPYYPGTGNVTDVGIGDGAGTTLNVPLPAGAGDTEIVDAFRQKLVPAARAFEPEFVFISAGFDAHRDDPLAGLDVTASGYRQLTQVVLDIAAKFAHGRVVSLLEGGYDLQALGRSVAAHVEELIGTQSEVSR